MPALSTDLLLFGGRALILLLGFITLSVCFVRWQRSVRRATQGTDARIDVVIAELRALNEQGASLREQVLVLGEQLQTHLRLTKAGNSASASGYDVAIRLARNGASAEEVVATSGVTRQEAQLLARLHGPDTVRHRMSA